MTSFRLLADDLTGALDSAARFTGRLGPIRVTWRDDPTAPTLALDGGTRELPEAEAMRRIASLAAALTDADLAFLKLDSLLRGHVAATVAGCAMPGRFNAVVIAPAFPAQGRITRHGRQLAHGSDVGVDLPGALAALGVSVALRQPGDDLPPGVSLWDAETDADLTAIAAMARGRVLWCGTGGLAGALGGAAPVVGPLSAPVLALVGSDHAVAAGQSRACTLRLTLGGPDDTTLPGHGAAIDVNLPAGLQRDAAAARIAETFAALLARIQRPGALIVTGGETLRGVCSALDANGLLVEGELSPGIPVSRMVGGRWPGLRIVSKSGAFGDAGLLARLLEGSAP